jgi:hypothetical protein
MAKLSANGRIDQHKENTAMTLEQVKALKYHDEVHYGPCRRIVGPRGGVSLKREVWRVNGRVRTWKTRPDDVEVPIKYGFNGPYSYIRAYNMGEFHLPAECPAEQDGARVSGNATTLITDIRQTRNGHVIVNGICERCDAGDPTSIITLNDPCTEV